MKTAAVTPIIGEFGYIVFDIQPKVRAWFRDQKAAQNIVFASRELAPLFDEATVFIEPPAELLPTVPATMRSIVYEYWAPTNPERMKIERLIAWAKAKVTADVWLEIPYFQGTPWVAPATYVSLESKLNPPDEPYVVIAARAREFDAWRNWPESSWDELVRRITEEWKVQVRCIGRPPSTYFPTGALPQETEENQRLDHSISLLNHAVCSISSNSGPTHLSLMAQCPTFAWGEPFLKTFMEKYTNPLGTPCHFFSGGWDPDVDSIWTALCRWKGSLESIGQWKINRSASCKLSMCMIARDSSRTIAAALNSVKPWVDEIVVVDTGSTDDTAAIAAEYGARVYHAPWQDSFSAARNESIRHASGQWVFWMDSDDTIDEDNGRKLRSLVDRCHSSSTMGYVLQVRCPADGESDGYQTATAVDHVKLFRKLPAIQFAGRIHEQVLPAIRRLGGDVEWTDIQVVHSGSDRTQEGRRKKQTRDLRVLELEAAEDPDNTFNLFNLGMTFLDMGRSADALNPLARSLQLAEAGESHIRKIYALLVQAYSELKRPETALQTCSQGLRVCPNDPELLFRKGVIEQSLGQSAHAEDSFKSIVAASPDRHFSSIDRGILGIKAWHNLAVIYEHQKRPELAAEAWRRVLDHDGTNRIAWRGLIDSLTAMKDISALEQLSGLKPASGMPRDIHLICRARLLAEQGDPTAAAIGLKRAIQETHSMDVLDELSQIAFSHNLLDLAEWGLRELCRQRPDDPSVFQNLGMVHLRRHNYSKAAESAKRSLQLRPDYRPAEQVLELALQSASEANALVHGQAR